MLFVAVDKACAYVRVFKRKIAGEERRMLQSLRSQNKYFGPVD